MNHKTTWLMASLLGLTVIAARSSETPPQTWRMVPQQPINADGARRFSDLYSVIWEEIPMLSSTPADPHDITADSINDGGTIAGRGSGALALWDPDTQVWEEVPKDLAGWFVFISPDGSSVLTTDFPQLIPNPTNILTWNSLDGWQALAGNTVDQSGAYNVSRNFRFVVGTGYNNGEPPQAWVWAMGGGVQQLLPTPDLDGVTEAFAGAASNDGNVVVGNAVRPAQSNGFYYNDYIATRWVEGGPPAILRDPEGNELYEASACNADCSIVFGTGVWFLKNDGEFGFLGTLPDGYPTPGPYGAYYVGDVSSDGSLLVGVYLQNVYPTNQNSETYANRPFIWTQETGMTSLRSLTVELGIGDENWGRIDTVRLSPNGRLFLIGGLDKSEQSRTVVLHLTPKTVRPTGGHSTHAAPTPPRANPVKTLRAGSTAAVD